MDVKYIMMVIFKKDFTRYKMINIIMMGKKEYYDVSPEYFLHCLFRLFFQ